MDTRCPAPPSRSTSTCRQTACRDGGGPLHRDYVISVLLGRRYYRRRQLATTAA